MPIGCTRLEKLLLAGADCSILKLAFYNLQSFRNLLVVRRGAVATEEELHKYVGTGYWREPLFPHTRLAGQDSNLRMA